MCGSKCGGRRPTAGEANLNACMTDHRACRITSTAVYPVESGFHKVRAGFPPCRRMSRILVQHLPGVRGSAFGWVIPLKSRLVLSRFKPETDHEPHDETYFKSDLLPRVG